MMSSKEMMSTKRSMMLMCVGCIMLGSGMLGIVSMIESPVYGPEPIEQVHAIMLGDDGEMLNTHAVEIETVVISVGRHGARISTIQNKGHLYIVLIDSDSFGITHSPDCPCLEGD